VEKELESIEDVKNSLGPDEVSWINIYGIHDMDLMKRVGDIFQLPPLLLEDILNTDQSPKFDDGETYDAFIMKMLVNEPGTSKIFTEQFTLILGENYVLTLQEQWGDVLDPVRERIRFKKGRVRLNSNDYLAYAILDTIVDNYAILIERLGREVEDMEDKIFRTKEPNIAEELYHYKTELNYLRKSVRPVRDIMKHLLKSENTFFQPQNRQYLKDLDELVEQSSEAIELYSNMVSDQLNIYSTNQGNRMNEVMKVLTIFASIFIPLTFLAGIYGMNFEYMPELHFKYSYPIFWTVSILVVMGLLYYFRRKRWL
jgi:magnesium transporter